MRLVTLVLCAVVIGTVQENRAHSIAFVGGTVVDLSAFGRGTADIRNSVVIVRNGRITAVGTRPATKIPRDAEVIDATGKFIVPGLHDVFATIDNQAYANAFLYMGVTAIVANEAPSSRRDGLFLTGTPSPRVYRMATVQGFDNTGLTPAPRSIADLMTRGRRMTPAELTSRVDGLASGVKVLLCNTPSCRNSCAWWRRTRDRTGHDRRARRDDIPGGDRRGRAGLRPRRDTRSSSPRPTYAKVAALPFGPPRIPCTSIWSASKATIRRARYRNFGTSG